MTLNFSSPRTLADSSSFWAKPEVKEKIAPLLDNTFAYCEKAAVAMLRDLRSHKGEGSLVSSAAQLGELLELLGPDEALKLQAEDSSVRTVMQLMNSMNPVLMTVRVIQTVACQIGFNSDGNAYQGVGINLDLKSMLEMPAETLASIGISNEKLEAVQTSTPRPHRHSGLLLDSERIGGTTSLKRLAQERVKVAGEELLPAMVAQAIGLIGTITSRGANGADLICKTASGEIESVSIKGLSAGSPIVSHGHPKNTSSYQKLSQFLLRDITNSLQVVLLIQVDATGDQIENLKTRLLSNGVKDRQIRVLSVEKLAETGFSISDNRRKKLAENAEVKLILPLKPLLIEQLPRVLAARYKSRELAIDELSEFELTMRDPISRFVEIGQAPLSRAKRLMLLAVIEQVGLLETYVQVLKENPATTRPDSPGELQSCDFSPRYPRLDQAVNSVIGPHSPLGKKINGAIGMLSGILK